MRGVYRVVYRVQRLIDCHVCVRVGPKVVGLVRGGEKPLEPIERIAHYSRYREVWPYMDRKWDEGVHVLREASAISEERQSVNMGNSIHFRKNMGGQSGDKWTNGDDRYLLTVFRGNE